MKIFHTRTGKQMLSSDRQFLYTYDIVFEKSNLTLSTRWDHYKSKERKNIRWFGIILSNCMMIFYSIIICYIITTNLYDDIKNYNYRIAVLEIYMTIIGKKLQEMFFVLQ